MNIGHPTYATLSRLGHAMLDSSIRRVQADLILGSSGRRLQNETHTHTHTPSMHTHTVMYGTASSNAPTDDTAARHRIWQRIILGMCFAELNYWGRRPSQSSSGTYVEIRRRSTLGQRIFETNPRSIRHWGPHSIRVWPRDLPINRSLPLWRRPPTKGTPEPGYPDLDFGQ